MSYPKLTSGEWEYAMIPTNADSETFREFVGYREGMELDKDGTILAPGRYVPGSNNGWTMRAAVGGVQIYVRRALKNVA